LPANDFSLPICNDTTANTKIEDLTIYQENLITNSSSYIFEYFDKDQVSISDFKNRNLSIGENIFYVKVSTAQGCFKLVKLTLQLNAKPEINLPENAEFCNGLSVELDVRNNPNYTYEWNTGEKTHNIIVNKEGTYSVKVTTEFGCENSASVVVKRSILADILKVEIINNNATVILSATGDFLYSLDNKTFQTANVFKDLNNGNYTVYVKTQQGCIIGEMNFSIFNITNSFSPNGDGKNDTWKIGGLENYPNSEVSVYDSLGKRVFYKITSGSFEWDGKLNDRNLATATYWYIIKVSDGRILNGYLLLKNRN
jgi:gliding motility-associated-like protein